MISNPLESANTVIVEITFVILVVIVTVGVKIVIVIGKINESSHISDFVPESLKMLCHNTLPILLFSHFRGYYLNGAENIR